MKDNKFDATEGTVYRRTSKRRLYPTPHLRNSQKCYFVTRWLCSAADAPRGRMAQGAHLAKSV
jgi:hypothetical protein